MSRLTSQDADAAAQAAFEAAGLGHALHAGTDSPTVAGISAGISVAAEEHTITDVHIVKSVSVPTLSLPAISSPAHRSGGTGARSGKQPPSPAFRLTVNERPVSPRDRSL